MNARRDRKKVRGLYFEIRMMGTTVRALLENWRGRQRFELSRSPAT